jgi:hypothetical protein
MTRNDVAWATFDSYPNLGPHAVRFQPVLRRFRKFLTHACGNSDTDMPSKHLAWASENGACAGAERSLHEMRLSDLGF